VLLALGDMAEGAGDPSNAIRLWAWGIALFDKT